MEKKQVIIQHSCVFTRTSLEYMLNTASVPLSTTVVASVDSLADCDRLLRCFPDVQLIILNLQGKDASAGDCLSRVVSRLRKYYPRCRVMIITEAFCVRLLRQYFYGVSQVCAVMAHSAPLGEFMMQITSAFFLQLPSKWERPPILTGQERVVLALLLRGQSNNAIAESIAG